MKFSDNEDIRIALTHSISRRYAVASAQGKAIKIRLHESETLCYYSYSTFWLPISSLKPTNIVCDSIRSFEVMPWFEKVATRKQLISLGKKI